MWKNLDLQCGWHSAVYFVSYVDFGVSIFLFVATAPLTVAILIGIYKYRHLLNRNYYLVITNIVIADCIMATICDPMSISFHIKEALGAKEAGLQKLEQTTMTFIFFFTNIIAVLSMTVLAIDRLGVILCPFFYYSFITKFRIKIILLSTWILSACITITYTFIGYIRFLAIFAFSAVVFTLIFMIVTMFLLRRRLRIAKQQELQRCDSLARPAVKNQENSRNKKETSLNLNLRRKTENDIEFTEVDRKITKTFLWTLVFFVLNYLPCIILIVYMNICTTCDCGFVHIMRDFVWLAILSSPLCRSLNFIFRLTALREAVKNVFVPAEKDSSNLPLQAVKQNGC